LKVELAELAVGDPPERWSALGFTVAGGAVDLGGVRVRLGAAGAGIVSWSLRGVEAGEIDGLATLTALVERAPSVEHANTAMGIDHVVVVSPDFDRTSAALAAAAMPLRRVRDAGGFRQGFRRLGSAILELVETPDAPDGPARFWGLVVVVGDLDGVAGRLGESLGTIRAAVQPGRRIATLRPVAGLGPALAFMDPEPT
jgi:hypothetical protein